MKRANTMSTITVELTIKVKTKFTSSNAEKTNGFISPQMSEIFTFVDNESAKEALVKGSSFNAQFRALLLQLEVAEKDIRSWLWISRVPSHSNE